MQHNLIYSRCPFCRRLCQRPLSWKKGNSRPEWVATQKSLYSYYCLRQSTMRRMRVNHLWCRTHRHFW